MTHPTSKQKTEKPRSSVTELKLARKAFDIAKHRFLTTEEKYKLAAERLQKAVKAVEAEL